MHRKKRNTALFLSVLAACTLPDLTAPVESMAAVHWAAAADQPATTSPSAENQPAATSPSAENQPEISDNGVCIYPPESNNVSADPLADGTPADPQNNSFTGNTLELSTPPSVETAYSDNAGGTVTVSSDGNIRMDNAGSQSPVKIILSGGDSWTLTEQTGTNNVELALASDTKLTIPAGKNITLLNVLSEGSTTGTKPELVNEGILKLPSDADCLQSEKVSITGAGVLNLETRTDTTIGTLSSDKLGANIARKFVFTGTGHLTIENIFTGADDSTVTVQDGAHVTISNRLSIGSSGNVNGTLSVTGSGTLILNDDNSFDNLHITDGGKLVSRKPLSLFNPPEIDAQSTLQLEGRPALSLEGSAGHDALTEEQKDAFRDSLIPFLPDSYTIGDWTDSSNGFTYFTILDKSTMQPPEGGLVLSLAKIDISSDPDIQVNLTLTDFEYDGTAKTPAATVTRDGQTLTEGTDYTITYTSHTNAGEAAAVITGIGDYCGERTVTFRIRPAVPVLSFGSHNTQTSVYSGHPAVINNPPVVTLAGGETYSGEIQYSYTSMGQDNYISGLPSATGTYQIRASIPATGNYTEAVSEDLLTLTIVSASSGSSSGGYYPSGGSFWNPVFVQPDKKQKIYRTETIHHPDGSVTTIVTEQDDSFLRITETKTEVISPSAIRYTQTVITSPPREIVRTQVTTEWMPDGSCVSTKIYTDKTESTTSTITTTKPDGSRIKETTTMSSNSLGRDVRLTVRYEMLADGTLSGITETSVISGAERSRITVTVQKDGSGNVKSSSASIRNYKNGRMSFDKTDFQEIREAAQGADTAVTLSFLEQDGRQACTIRTTTSVMEAGGIPQLFQIRPSTGERVLVPYVLSADKDGNIIPDPEAIADGTYEMLSEKEGEQAGKAISETVLPKDSSITISFDNSQKAEDGDTSSSQIQFKKAWNIKSMDYQTDNRIVTVSKNGKITPLKPGTTEIEVTVTLKNNTVKKENITVKVVKKKAVKKNSKK